MADYVAAHITIGGTVPTRIVPELCKVIGEQGVSLDWGEVAFCPQAGADMLRACRDVAGRKVLRLYRDEVAYGNLSLLQTFLASCEIPFDRWHESKYEIPCELMVYRPGSDLQIFLTDLEGAIVVRAEPLAGLADLLQETHARLRTRGRQAALQVLRRCLRLTRKSLPQQLPLPALTIGVP